MTVASTNEICVDPKDVYNKLEQEIFKPVKKRLIWENIKVAMKIYIYICAIFALGYFAIIALNLTANALFVFPTITFIAKPLFKYVKVKADNKRFFNVTRVYQEAEQFFKNRFYQEENISKRVFRILATPMYLAPSKWCPYFRDTKLISYKKFEREFNKTDYKIQKEVI
jgi:hypothetical protein